MYLCLYVQPLAGVVRGQGRAEVLAASQSQGGDRTPQDPPGTGRSAERARSCLSSARLGGVPWAWDQGRSCGWRAGGGQQCSAARWGAPPPEGWASPQVGKRGPILIPCTARSGSSISCEVPGSPDEQGSPCGEQTHPENRPPWHPRATGPPAASGEGSGHGGLELPRWGRRGQPWMPPRTKSLCAVSSYAFVY